MKSLIGCMVRVLVVLLIILVLLLVLVQFLGGGSCIRKIDRSIPTAELAPWEVTTLMKLYYAEDAAVIRDQGGAVSAVTMTGWYEQLNGKWIRHAAPVTLEARIYGPLTVQRRVSSP